MSERLSGIEAFVAAVEAGSFAAAALRLQRTRSAVAKSVARLETRLGTRLFQRSTRSQSLTEDGQAYYERCRRALAELDAADAAVEAGRTAPRGTLRVTAPILLGRELVAPLLLELTAAHPGLVLEMVFSDSVVPLVDERIDLAVRSGPLPDSSVLAARAMGRQWMGVYAAPAYLERHPAPAGLDALFAHADRHRFVGYARDTGPHPWQFRGADGRVRAFDPSASIAFGSNSLEANKLAAIAGMGLARLPAWLVADALAAGTLVQVFAEPQPYGYALQAVWPQARALPLKTRAAIDLLAHRLPGLLAAGRPAGPSPSEAGD
ncbi:LysR family transcriptional regulator [Paracidovorax cattleyae]|uniref:DNA-binding transcriptional regulator, LysR family n=1 Tax=Paracidovorax cattleyae TaxID=80868 RepID=A0A1H0SW27_9BURK|nr:LysR family transcriptional regulator [Paracidovorax cattleyae]AVS74606.1 LysR family transcriptional regulator [Paracidovorax cattleyae]MBF9264808.1 LysR family transcriptional regulator [Paracidovorax cattleyae]SDP45931.1 DNA-binding transcriptional regulator, LysR family [Paracidovorax cattleyae]